VVEGSGFENRRRGNPTRGSNPFSSAEVTEESAHVWCRALESTELCTKLVDGRALRTLLRCGVRRRIRVLVEDVVQRDGRQIEEHLIRHV
jgi:hypothetical protein